MTYLILAIKARLEALKNPTEQNIEEAEALFLQLTATEKGIILKSSSAERLQDLLDEAKISLASMSQGI